MQRSEKFEKIYQAYDLLDKEEVSRRGNVLKDTQLGFFVPSEMEKVFEFFEKIELQNYKNFIDLGSGDGRVVLIASLFTKATGIESDEGLYQKSMRMKDQLKIDDKYAEFIKGNFLEHDISGYDSVYMYPDNKISPELDEKIKTQLKGDMLIFTDTFVPECLKTKEIKLDWQVFVIGKNI